MGFRGASSDRITRRVAIVSYTLAGVALVVLAPSSGRRRELMIAVALVCLAELSMAFLAPEWPRNRDATGTGGARRTAMWASQAVLLVIGLCLAALSSAWFLILAADAVSNLFVIRRTRGAP